MKDIILVILVVAILFLLKLILNELRVARAFRELPTSAKDFYDKRLSEIDGKIKEAFALYMVTPIDRKEALEARKGEFTELIKERDEIIKDRRDHFHVRSEYLKKG